MGVITADTLDLLGSPWMPPDGHTVTAILSNGTIPAQGPVIVNGELNNSTKNGTSHPYRIKVSNLDLTGVVRVVDPTHCLLENLNVHDGNSNGLIRIRAYDLNNMTCLIRRCRVHSNTLDGISVDKEVGASVADCSRTIVTVENCWVYDVGTATPAGANQALTTHQQATLIVDGGYYTSAGTSAVAPEASSSRIILRRATIIGPVTCHWMEGCTLDTLGGSFILFGKTGLDPSIIDSTLLNVSGFTVDYPTTVKRCRIVQNPTTNGTMFNFRNNGGSHLIEACVIIGSNLSSNRCIGGATQPSQNMVCKNNLFHNFNAPFNMVSANWASLSTWYNLYLGNTKFNQSMSVPVLGGRWNFYDSFTGGLGSWASLTTPAYNVAPTSRGYDRSEIATDGKFLSGTGASAYPMMNYANDDFLPDLRTLDGQPLHKLIDWGADNLDNMAALDIYGNPYTMPTPGPYAMSFHRSQPKRRTIRR